MIIVDDCSTDKTGAIGDELGKCHPKVKAVRRRVNDGKTEALIGSLTFVSNPFTNSPTSRKATKPFAATGDLRLFPRGSIATAYDDALGGGIDSEVAPDDWTWTRRTAVIDQAQCRIPLRQLDRFSSDY